MAAERVLGDGALEPAGLADRAADVLLVDPAVHDPDRDEVADASPGRSGVHESAPSSSSVSRARTADALGGDLAEVRPGPARGSRRAGSRPGSRCSRRSGCGCTAFSATSCSGAGPAEEHLLRPDDVREVVLHRPAGTVGVDGPTPAGGSDAHSSSRRVEDLAIWSSTTVVAQSGDETVQRCALPVVYSSHERKEVVRLCINRTRPSRWLTARSA